VSSNQMQRTANELETTAWVGTSALTMLSAKRGKLRMKDERITFATHSGEILLSSRLAEARAEYPLLWRGAGFRLHIGGKRWVVQFRSPWTRGAIGSAIAFTRYRQWKAILVEKGTR
jgi:hypothetical protein